MNDLTISEPSAPVALQDLLNGKSRMRFIEVHNGLSTLIACSATRSNDGREFDGIWVSSLTCSASSGLPDLEMPGIDKRVSLIGQIARTSNKPVIVDGDTGGSLSQLRYFCRELVCLGVGGVVFEEKAGEKRNSLDEPDQILADPAEFATKIQAANDAVAPDSLMVIARLEGYNAGQPTKETLKRAATYIEAGAHGIFVHSKSRDSHQVLEFISAFRKAGFKQPVLCVPTAFYQTSAFDLFEGGVNGIIYANQQLRAAAAAMIATCSGILEKDGVFDIEERLLPTKTLLDLVGYSDEIQRVARLQSAAGDPEARER